MKLNLLKDDLILIRVDDSVKGWDLVKNWIRIWIRVHNKVKCVLYNTDHSNSIFPG